MEHAWPIVREAVLRHGYLVILIIMLVEEAGVPSPLPGDGLLVFAGYLCSVGRLNLAGSVLTVVGGALIGATILYWVARKGGRALVQKYGRFIRLDERRLDQLHDLFERLGYFGPGVARLIPGLRIYTSALAGLASIPYPVFIFNVIWAGLAWALTFLLLGYYFGVHWREYIHLSQHLTLLTIVGVVLLVVAYIWLHRRRTPHRRKPPSLDPHARDSQG
jgi:membrane protein DedA with SNARE-associated domain